MAATVTRAGQFVKQPQGYRAFIPAPLPPEPPIDLDARMIRLLSRADQAVGRLDGIIHPPPESEMWTALDNFEKFLHVDHDLPDLVHCGLAHAQFETIHPFLDGNGRVGRLLITFLLSHRRVLHRPLLYVSYYLKAHRAEYYDRLMAIREQGDWEGWLRFFLRGVADTAEEATDTARSIVRMHAQHRALIQNQGLGLNGVRLLDLLYHSPIVNIRWAEQQLDVAYVTARKLVGQMEALGLLQETTGGTRNRRFRYTPYLSLFADPMVEAEPDPAKQLTAADTLFDER